MLTLALLWMIGYALELPTAYWVIWWIMVALSPIRLLINVYKAGKDSGSKD